MLVRIVRSCCLLVVLSPAIVCNVSAEGAATAQVQIVYRYNHDPVKVVVANTTHELAYGHRTGWFAIPPSSSRHEGISVTSVKHHCGVGEPDEVFQAGHRYKVVVYPSRDRCFIGGGKSISSPEFTPYQGQLDQQASTSVDAGAAEDAPFFQIGTPNRPGLTLTVHAGTDTRRGRGTKPSR